MAYVLITFLLLIYVTTCINARLLKSDHNYLHKCCPFGQYIARQNTCEKHSETLNFANLDVYTEDLDKTGKSIDEVFTLLPNKIEDEHFKNQFFDVTLGDFNIYIIESGALQLEMPNAYDRWIRVANGNFCIDYRNVKGKITLRYLAILPDDNLEMEETESSMYSIAATLVSCFFMLLVLIVYFLLPELQNLGGMILMAYVASLFLAFLLLAIIQIQRHTKEACICLTMGIYYFFLASFCWISIMSLDIWWTFRGYAKSRRMHRRGENFKFLMYCVYAWGVPLGMTIALAVLNTVDMKHLPWFITPHVPELGCFLEGGTKLLYLYIPMLILILCNWMFYLMTAFNIWRLSRGTGVLDSAAAGNPKAHRTSRHRFMIYLKLSIVMGLNWLLEIVSFLYPGFKMWYITDAYNILIGFAIFLIFVCKKKIFKKLSKRFLSKQSTRWYPSSKSYSSHTSDSNPETTALQMRVSSHPQGLNGYSTTYVERLD